MSLARTARSTGWRVNSSSIKAVEGAYVLRALQKVAGAASLPGGYRVRFATAANLNDPENEDVKIEAGDMLKAAPVPPEKLDILVGRTLHEVEHHHINSSGVWGSSHYKVPAEERELFRQFVDIGEDILIDHRLTSNRNISDYYYAALEYALAGRRPPRLNNLMEIWVEYSLAGNSGIVLNVPDELADAVRELESLTDELKIPMDRLTGTRARAELYLSSWNFIKDYIYHPPELPEASSGGEGEMPSEPGERTVIDGQTRPGPSERKGAERPDKQPDYAPPINSGLHPLDQHLADEIEEALTSDTEDITERIYSDFDEAGFGHGGMNLLVTRRQETKTPPIVPDPEQCRRLERILTIRRRLQARVMRGELYGKLDMRKLHRSQTDQRMFRLRYQFPDGFPDTAILVDMSGSMTGEQAEEVIVAATSLAHVAKCEVWAYAESGSEIAITRLNEGRFTHSRRPEGNTPSGVALVGVANTLKRGGLIIHLTDGEHNVEFGPAEATQVLKRKGVDAVHLLWSSNAGLYTGLKYEILAGGLNEFPDALYRILLEQLQLQSLNGK